MIAGAALLAPAGASAAPDKPSPTVGSVTAQLDTLSNQTEALTERYNAAQLEVARARKAVTGAQRRAALAAANVHVARDRLVQMAAAQYESAPLGTTGALLSSDSGQEYLDSIATRDLLNKRNGSIVDQLTAAQAAARSAQQTAKSLLADATTKRDALNKQRDKIVSETAKFRALLATLTAPQRRAYTGRGAPSQAQVKVAYAVHAGNAAAQKAVDFAVAQIGKPYVFAAAGPDAFDCSGLTMAAWSRGGVSLPHLARSQYNYGRHIPASDLQPGDLVFLYSDIHHVEIYIGNGLAISAPQEGENVKIVRVASSMSDFHGATRLT